ncbi:restriction endonuclease subunit S [Pseudomonas aeruginosa]|uniref:restriction endonuclease subunit S n=1 Tax=Pseudomonas aeruginosa TaxID=287 RepID=UPI00383A5417
MSELQMPELHRPLADLVTQVDAKITSKKDQSKPYVGLEHIPSKGAYLLGWGKADSSISTNSIFSKDDVLFGKLRPNLRKCIAAPFDGYCSTDILVLRANDGIVPGFAVRVFQTEAVGAAAEKTSIGTKMPRTSWGHLGSEVVFCPDGKEQAKIAHVLDTLDTVILQTEAIVEKLKQVKQGLLHDLLTRGVDANGELRPSYEAAPDLYQKTVIGWRPKDWEICQVSSVLSGIDAGKSPDCQDIPAKGDQWGVLKVGAVHPDGLKLNENKVVEEARLKNPAYLVRNGDLLLSRANTFELVGLVCYVTNHPERLMLSDKTLRLSVKANRMTTNFLFWQLQHPKTRTQIEIAATGTSGSMKNISQGGVEQLWISRPQIDEQEEITKRLLAALDRYRDEQEKLSKMREMKSGLMDDLLTGRVRVTPLLAQ